ncbi:right-handed parallel beta-helix repeat-containing protein [Brucella sp.]|uniref:right-handed parallel beta-helix repeat-containing protein n=1 Tax=Brucella sp. TaxID=52132 RepID=UPI0028A586E4|nr:right-handed parallel beta-helix repeat-containing protein [Brucella sp.]
MTVRTIDDIFRDFVIDGVPASGPFNPHKPDIRDTLKALTEGSENFPDNRVIRLNNADEGTANNIIVTASVAIPAAAYQVLYILNVTQENTGPVKVSGAINRDLVTNTSAPVPSGYLTPGMAVLCIDTGSALRMLSYGDMETLLAEVEVAVLEAEAARDAAEQARDEAKNAASDAVAQGNVPIYSTRNAVETLEIPAGINAIRTNGFATVGDGGASLYKRVASEPTHAGKFQSADGAWWEIADIVLNLKQFGAIGDGVTPTANQMQDAIDAHRILKRKLMIPDGTFIAEKRLTIGSDTYIEGYGDRSILKVSPDFRSSITPWITYGLIWNNGTSRAVPDKNIILRNFRADGSRDALSSTDQPNNGPLIYLATQDGSPPMENITIEGVFIDSSWQGNDPSYGGLNGTMGLLIENAKRVSVLNNRAIRTGRDGLSVAGLSSDIVISGNHVEGSGDDGISLNSSAFHQTNPGVVIRNAIVSNNTIRNAGARGILLSNVVGGSVSGNVIDGTTSWGILVDTYNFGYFSDIVVANNTVIGASTYIGDLNSAGYQQAGGIRIYPSPQSTSGSININVTNNSISSPAKDGIFIDQQSSFQLLNVNVSNNTIYNTGRFGITSNKIGSGGLEQVSVSNNSIRQSADSGIYMRQAFVCNVENNTVFNAGVSSDLDPISLLNVINARISSNSTIDTRGASARHAAGLALNTVTDAIIEGNFLKGYKGNAIYVNASSSLTYGTNKPTIP